MFFLVQNVCSSGAFFLQNGAPSWCKICAHLVLLKLENGAFSGAKFVLIWCFFSSKWCA